MKPIPPWLRDKAEKLLARAQTEGRDPVQMLYDYGLLVSPSFVASVKEDAAHEVYELLAARNWRFGNPTPQDVYETALRLVSGLEESYRRGV